MQGRILKLIIITVVTCMLICSCTAPATYNWQNIREYEEQGPAGTEQQTELKYKIMYKQAVVSNRFLQLPIVYEKRENTYNVFELKKYGEYEEYKMVTAEAKFKAAQKRTLIGLVVGGIVGLSMGVSLLTTMEEEPSEGTIFLTIFGLPIGFGVTGAALAIGGDLNKIPLRIEKFRTEKTATGRMDSKLIATEMKKSFGWENQIFSSKAASAIPVRIQSSFFGFSSEGGYSSNNIVEYTGHNGLVSVEFSGVPNNWGFNSQDALNSVRKSDVFNYFKQDAIPNVMTFLEDEIFDKSFPVTVSTIVAESATDIKVINDEKQIDIPGKTISPEAVYSAAGSLISKMINDNIKTVTISVKDYDSHAAVNSGTVKARIKAPEVQYLLQPYFKEPLMDWAEDQISYYNNGEVEQTFGDDGQVFLSLYLPSHVEIEVIHPKYFFVKESMSFSLDNTRKTLYMSEKGQKMRVRIVDR